MKPLTVVPLTPPPVDQRVRRNAEFAPKGERRTRYSLPVGLQSTSPVGYRTRLSMTADEARELMPLLSLEAPSAFAPCEPPTDAELFEECSLGILSARQSTNYRGQRQVSFGPQDSQRIAELLKQLKHLGVPVLDGACYTHIGLTRPYRTPFTLLLTFVGHQPFLNMLTVPVRAWRKRYQFRDDIPTIGYLQQLHLGVWADGLERAVVMASGGRRRAQIHLSPFTSQVRRDENRAVLDQLNGLCGLCAADKARGWRIGFVAQVGGAIQGEALDLDPGLTRKLGANLMAFRSERIQPGVNAEEKAPDAYQHRQDMDVPEELRYQAGRAAFNAFGRWVPCEREVAKELLLLDRIDVLTPGGKERLRAVRKSLNDVTDDVIRRLPLWADLPTGKAMSKNANRGRKAFALVGQRIYIAGLSRAEIDAEGLDWEHALTAVGAAACRSALYCEIMGCVDLPPDCDLLAGVCLMAGPVNQNDIGKAFYGHEDLMAPTHGPRNPTSLLVWTLKAKTIADPIGNEEQLLNADRKGALVELRPGPHEVVQIARGGQLLAFRAHEGRHSQERAFADQDNFVTSPSGIEIPGNRGEPWPAELAAQPVWPGPDRAWS